MGDTTTDLTDAWRECYEQCLCIKDPMWSICNFSSNWSEDSIQSQSKSQEACCGNLIRYSKMCKNKGPRMSKTTLKNNVGGLVLWNIKAKIAVTQIVYWYKDKQHINS